MQGVRGLAEEQKGSQEQQQIFKEIQTQKSSKERLLWHGHTICKHQIFLKQAI